MKKFNGLTIILSFLSIAHISANTSPSGAMSFATDNALYSPQTPTSMFSQPIDQILGQLYAVHGILSDLSAIMSDNQIKGITKNQKKKNLSNIKSLMLEIEQKKNVLITGRADLETINFVLRFSRAAMIHVNKALDNQLKTFPQFDAESLIKKLKSAKPVSEKTIRKRIINNNKLLITLKKAANSAGLRWYNKAYRKLDRWMIQPMSKYGLVVGSVGLIGTYVWWHLNSKSCPLTKLVGHPAKLNPGGWISNDPDG